MKLDEEKNKRENNVNKCSIIYKMRNEKIF